MIKSLYFLWDILWFSSLYAQTSRKVYPHADVLATVRQHDRRVGVWQPRLWERSKYRCHEHARCWVTGHQCAVVILSHLAVISRVISCCTSRGRHSPHPPWPRSSSAAQIYMISRSKEDIFFHPPLRSEVIHMPDRSCFIWKQWTFCFHSSFPSMCSTSNLGF